MISIMEILMEESGRVECHDGMYLVVHMIINILWHWHLLFRIICLSLGWHGRRQSFLSICG